MESEPYPSYSPSSGQPTYARPDAPARSRLPLLLTLLAILVAVWYLPTYLQQVAYSRTRGEVQALREELPSFELRKLSTALTLTPKVIGPSVVHINTQRGNVFRGYQQGQGSGVIVDPAGYIVTNNHVIENAQTASVHLINGESYPASLVGRDPQNDLAVLKINAPVELVAAEWGDSDKLEVGELVWAVGNPFGLDRSVTFGIISAKDRSGFGGNPQQVFLQTDAAVNPGNSGGPLVDVDGKIIGINTAIIGESFAGVGFAIPSALAKQKYEEIRAGGTAAVAQQVGYIGIGMVDARVVRQRGVQQSDGAFVIDVAPDGPAAQAGIRAGDIIVRWGEEEIVNTASLILLVSRAEIGSTVTVGVLREGEEIDVDVVVGERPPSLLEMEPQR